MNISSTESGAKARTSNLVRYLYREQGIPYPDKETVRAFARRYPFEREDVARAIIMDQIACPKCGARCEYYGGTATCMNLKCGAQYPW